MKLALLPSLLIATGLFLSSLSSATQAAQCTASDQPVQVSAVYPTADTLPENLLRFYIYFDRPMKTQHTLDNVYLTDDNGKRLDGVFLDNKFNLWSPDRTRLTLLFDPGRVKTGLVAHNTLGRALQTGKRYHLTLDTGAINEQGCSSIFTKTFDVEPANLTKPSISRWRINQPKGNSKMTLTVNFKQPIDHTSLAFRLRVKNANNEVVAGAIDLAENEQQWRFTPDQNWQGEQSYSLFVDPVLEDIAGNRITGLFDQPSLIDESKKQNQYIKIPIQLSH